MVFSHIKKCLIFPLIFFFTCKAGFSSSPLQELELYANLYSSIPKAVYQKDDFTLSTFSLTYGLKLTSNPFDFRFYQKTSSIKISDFQNFSSVSDFQNHQKKPAWSFNMDFSKIPGANAKIPFSVNLGTLNFSQIVSCMKNPSFYSNPSPFSGYLSFDSGLGISGAQKSAYEKPVSMAVSYKGKNFTADAAVNENSDFMISSSTSFMPSDFAKISLSAGFSTFTLASKLQTSWQSPAPFFSEDKQWSLCLELLASVPFFQAKFFGGTVSNPYSTLRFFSTFEFFFHYGIFSLSGGIFTADTPFIQRSDGFYTLSGSIEKTLYQFKINPKITVFCKDTVINCAITALYDYSLDEAGYNRHGNQKMTVTAGSSVKFSDWSISFLYKLNNLTLGEFSGPDAHKQPPVFCSSLNDAQDLKHSFSLRYTHYLKNMTVALNAKETFSSDSLRDKAEHSQTFSASASFRQFLISNAALSVNLDYKNNTVTPKFTLGLTASQNLKKVKFTGKFQVCTTLLVE